MSPKLTEITLSWLRAFAAAALAVFLTQLETGRELDLSSVLTAGACAALPPLIRWLDATDPAFGRGSE